MNDPQIDKELRYHFDRIVRDHIASGLDETEARRRARLEFGGIAQIGEEVRDVRGHWLSDFAHDLRYAVRTLRRSPGFLAVSVLSLALGIGANTAIFSLIEPLMLRPLPIPEPERLVQPTAINSRGPLLGSLVQFEFIRDRTKSFTAVAAEMESHPAIVIDGVEEQVPAELVTGDFYRAMGIQPAAGRLLQAADDVPSPEVPAAVIGYNYWQRRFGGNPAVIGKTFELVILHRTVTIVGVTPEGYSGVRLDRAPDLTLPLQWMNTDPRWHFAQMNFLETIARLRPGVTMAQADAELQVIWDAYKQQTAPQLPQQLRAEFLKRRAAVIPAAHGFSGLRDDYSGALLLLMGIVGLVLLLACANLSGLLLARAESRQREISIRLAVGAGAGRLMRQFLTESLLLAAMGGGLGLLLAQRFSGALVALMTAHTDNLFISTAPDWRVLAFTAGISVLACIAAGFAPAWHALRGNVNPGLKKSRGANAGLGKALVVAQLSISMVLVVGAALFTATLVKLYSVDRGIRTEGVLSLRVSANQRFPESRSAAAVDALEASLDHLPGVVSASAAEVVQIGGGIWTRTVQIEGNTNGPDSHDDVAFNDVGPKYFATIGMPLLMGRVFDERDNSGSTKVAIVSQSFAQAFLGGQSPIGRRVTSNNVTYEIVGMVADSKYQDLRHGPPKAMYIPWRQIDNGDVRYSFLLRVASGDPRRFTPILDKLVRAADPDLRIRAIQTYEELIADTIVTERLMAMLGGFFGILALLIASLGIFGLMAFQVSRRTNEIGVRMALGAARSGIIALVLREVAVMAAIGCALGAGAALTLTGLTRKMLFGVTSTDPAVFATAAAMLALATLAAAWLPARRAARIDPLAALRHE